MSPGLVLFITGPRLVTRLGFDRYLEPRTQGTGCRVGPGSASADSGLQGEGPGKLVQLPLLFHAWFLGFLKLELIQYNGERGRQRIPGAWHDGVMMCWVILENRVFWKTLVFGQAGVCSCSSIKIIGSALNRAKGTRQEAALQVVEGGLLF